MPKFVKGAKHVYGWFKVGNKGKILIPKEAMKEYNLGDTKKAFLIPSSRRSGGFGLATKESLEKSPMASVILAEQPELMEFGGTEGEFVEINGRPYCWVTINKDGSIRIPNETLKRYGINPGEELLSVKGSHLALGFLSKGPIIEEAKKHNALEIFE